MKYGPIATVVALSLNMGCASLPVGATDLTQRQDVRGFIDEMSARHQFKNEDLTAWFQATRLREDIIKVISRPAESKPWYDYRPIFLQRSRIKGGATFWKENAATLARAEEVSGVPAHIIVAILGVETRYGGHTGGYRVMDALSTLAFDYPPRSKFFRSELEQYLLLAREEGIHPLEIKGSYAGAMGQAQFISSSYRHYAVDFDGDGKRDLWDNNADAIGSIANYLQVHGWEPGAPIAAPAATHGVDTSGLVAKGLKPALKVAEIKKSGIEFDAALADEAPATLIELEQKNGPEYWVGLQNFYVITRYNHSALYAMAVYQLAEEIRTLRAAQLAHGD